MEYSSISNNYSTAWSASSSLQLPWEGLHDHCPEMKAEEGK